MLGSYNSIDLTNFHKITDYKITKIEKDIIYIEDEKGKKGFMRLNSKNLLPYEVAKPMFERLNPFDDEYAIVVNNSVEYGLVSKDGNIINLNNLMYIKYLEKNNYYYIKRNNLQEEFVFVINKSWVYKSDKYTLYYQFKNGFVVFYDKHNDEKLLIKLEDMSVKSFNNIYVLDDAKFIGQETEYSAPLIYSSTGEKIDKFNCKIGNWDIKYLFRINFEKLCVYDGSEWNITDYQGNILKILNYDYIYIHRKKVLIY